MPFDSSLKFIYYLACLDLVAEDGWSSLSLLTRTCHWPRRGGRGSISPTLETNKSRRRDCAAGIGVHLFPIKSANTYTRLRGRLLVRNYRSATTYMLPSASSYKLFFLTLASKAWHETTKFYQVNRHQNAEIQKVNSQRNDDQTQRKFFFFQFQDLVVRFVSALKYWPYPSSAILFQQAKAQDFAKN